MKKYKIAFVTEYLSPQKNGIAVRYSNLIKYFKNDKDFDVVDVYGPKGHNVDFELVTMSNIFYTENYFGFINKENTKRLSSGYYDFIYFVLPPNFSYLYLAPIIKLNNVKTKIITSNHVNTRSYSQGYFGTGVSGKAVDFAGSFAYRYQNKMSDMIISPSLTEEIKDYVEPKKLFLSSNGYDQDTFKYHKKKSKTNKLLYFGRVAVEKNIDRTIDLFNNLSDKYTLDIIGDGPEMNRLVRQNQANERIKFLGKRDHNFISEHMRTCDISITSSLSETFCMTILESLATGTPVLYPQCSVFDSVYYPGVPEGRFDVRSDISFMRAVNNTYSDFDNITHRSYMFASSKKWENVYVDLKEEILNLLYI